VFKVRTVLELLQRLFPSTYLCFAGIFDALGKPDEAQRIDAAYQNLEPMNFSKDFLEIVAANSPETISVLPVRQVFWSDLGSPERIRQVQQLLRAKDLRPMPVMHPTRRREPAGHDQMIWHGHR
jgi:NDP-sugar pyrophosphorylase family protein